MFPIQSKTMFQAKSYIQYNSLKLTFLKISTQFFSRLRNSGFKKIWLRKHFSILKYEDHQKLMEDSHFFDSEYQVVLETEAEGLMVQDFKIILEQESPLTTMKINPSFQGAKTPDIPGTKDLSPAGPLTICGGMISGYPSYSYIQESGSLCKIHICLNNLSKDQFVRLLQRLPPLG